MPPSLIYPSEPKEWHDTRSKIGKLSMAYSLLGHHFGYSLKRGESTCQRGRSPTLPRPSLVRHASTIGARTQCPLEASPTRAPPRAVHGRVTPVARVRSSDGPILLRNRRVSEREDPIPVPGAYRDGSPPPDAIGIGSVCLGFRRPRPHGDSRCERSPPRRRPTI